MILPIKLLKSFLLLTKDDSTILRIVDRPTHYRLEIKWKDINGEIQTCSKLVEFDSMRERRKHKREEDFEAKEILIIKKALRDLKSLVDTKISIINSKEL
jgi:hypothetical protein